MARTPFRVRTGQAPPALTKTEFLHRFREGFVDPTFGAEQEALERIGVIAWGNYRGNRKAPNVRAAGAGFADPAYELSVEWRATRDALRAAERKQRS